MLQLDKKHFYAQVTVSVLVIATFIGVLTALVTTLFLPKEDLQPGVREVLVLLLGVLAGAFKEVTGFWLGSSAGSVRKTATTPPEPGQ